MKYEELTGSKIIVALDYDSDEQVNELLAKISPKLCHLKIGKGLFTRYGPSLVEKLIHQGYQIFLDLKFHDIPQQVANAVKAAAELGVWMMTIHASGGQSMMRVAKEALINFNTPPKLLAVTVLTSLSDSDMLDLGLPENVNENVLLRANLALHSGVDGLICSGFEAASLRQKFGELPLLVCPGIRLIANENHDQKRVMTPEQALINGANYLVIGRAVTQALDPHQMLEKISLDITNKVVT